MAFWQRIEKSKLKTAYFQFRRCYTHLPHASFSNYTPKTRPMVMPNPYSLFHDRPTIFLNSVRFYAAPVQFQVKPKKEDDDGTRLNDQIKAEYVRLVVDDGHSVVSRKEALERAKMLKLDLVEVDKNADIPVCKIMNYHKELYKKKESEKERAKSKSEMKMRKETKELRISEKTESKDVKMKSDMVRKLMEKGYRVKVKATGKADQSMLDSLSRLSALIEDVCVVEVGPAMAKKEAYMIVRHVKYGLPKKGVKKSKEEGDVEPLTTNEEGDVGPLTTNTSDSIEYENQSSPEYRVVPESPPVLENRYKKGNNRVENKVQSNPQVPPAVVENRYTKAEPRNRFQQPTPNTGPSPSPGPVPGTRDSNRWAPPNLNQPRHVPVSNTSPGPGPGPRDANRWAPPNLNQPRHVPVSNTSTGPGPGTRDANRWAPSNLNQPRHAPLDINFNPKIDIPPGSRNSMPSRDDINKNPRGPNTSPGYGLFSRDA